jgi:hypothetical protein
MVRVLDDDNAGFNCVCDHEREVRRSSSNFVSALKKVA